MGSLSPIREEIESTGDEVMDIIQLYGEEEMSGHADERDGKQDQDMDAWVPRPLFAKSSLPFSSSNITNTDAAVTENVLTLAKDMIHIVGKLYSLADDRYTVSGESASRASLSCTLLDLETVSPLEVMGEAATTDPVNAASKKLATAENRLAIAHAQARLAEDRLRLVMSQVSLAEDRLRMAREELDFAKARAGGCDSSRK